MNRGLGMFPGLSVPRLNIFGAIEYMNSKEALVVFEGAKIRRIWPNSSPVLGQKKGNDSLEDSANLPDPDIIAKEIVENLVG